MPAGRERVTPYWAGVGKAPKNERAGKPMKSEGIYELSRQQDEAAAQRSKLKPCPSLARSSGLRRRRIRVEPSGGIV